MPSIETERLSLRVPGTGDAESVAAYRVRNWDHLNRWEPTRPESWRTADYWRTRIGFERQQCVAGQGFLFLIEARPTAVALPAGLLGTVRLSDIVRANADYASTGYGLDAGAQGHGVMGEALEAVAAFAFNEMNLHRLEACVMPENIRSIHVLERCGFMREGLLKGSMRIQGRWEDHLIYGRLNDDWREHDDKTR